MRQNRIYSHVNQILNRVLNLRPGDFGRGWPFFLYYFFTIASYSMGQVARDALFLDRFKAVQLPYADMAIAALVGFVVAFYIRLSHRTGIKNLLVICLLFLSANAFVFWWAAHYTDWPWLFPVLYVWVGIFGVIVTMQVWALANFVWTTREAKRLFSLLGSGGILGGIFAGFFSNFAAKRFGTESLLIVVAVFILLCAGLVEFIWRHGGASASSSAEPPAADALPPTLTDSLRIIRKSSLLQTIAVLICLSSVVTTAAGWQLKAVAKEVLVQKDSLAAFFGSFYGYTGVLSLTVQLLITSKLLKRFGVGVALFVLPVFLMAGSAGLLLSGSLLAATLLKGSDKVFRYSVDTSAMQLLYLPIPNKTKFKAKSFIDTVVWRFGDGLAGLSLLIFATILGFTPGQIGWVNMALLVAWMSVAAIARGQYIATLRSNIQQLRLDPDHNSVPILDTSTTNLLAEKLQSKDPSEILYGLGLFEMGQEYKAHHAVRNLLDHHAPAVRAKAVAVLNASGDRTVRAQIEPLLRDESLGVRTEALMYMTRHDDIDPLRHIQDLGDFADYSIRAGTIAFLSKSGDPQTLDAARLMLDMMVREGEEKGQRTRLEAARLISFLPDQFEGQLQQLLHDSDPEVVQCAIRAVGTLRKRKFVPLVIGHLGNAALRDDAIAAFMCFEESIAGTLRDCLENRSVPIEIRREIPAVLVYVGTPEAMHILAANVLQVDNILRYRIIASLNKLRDRYGKVDVDTALVEIVLVAEITGHYRSYQILASADGAPTDPLKESMKDDLERIFRLMKILSPDQDLQSAYLSLQSRDAVTHANALELLDNTLRPQLRSLIVPLIDGEVSEKERVHLADRLLGVTMKTQKEAIAALMSSDDPWLRSCAELWSSWETDNTPLQ